MKKLLVANWKMNIPDIPVGVFCSDLISKVNSVQNLPKVVICPPAPILLAFNEVVKMTDIGLGGQDCHPEAAGAHTGDVSAQILVEAGCGFVILGHSERRAALKETNSTIGLKVRQAVLQGLQPIVCVGETEAEYKKNMTSHVVNKQLDGFMKNLPQCPNLIVAYEPIWAIGTGQIPTMKEISSVHQGIVSRIKDKYAFDGNLKVLYGGSVKPDNAKEIFKLDFVDGGLIGGASLSLDSFWKIILSCP